MFGRQLIDKAGKLVELGERRGQRERRRQDDPWLSIFGQVAIASFVLVFVTGILLAIWFEPSMSRVVYDGGYESLRGVPMSEAYASTLDLSFEVRGGLLMRQIHQWGSLVFVAALAMYMLRVFFTGGFRRLRMANWLLILALLVFGMIDAYLGHLLPDDLLSGTSLRVMEGIMLAIPFIGTSLAGLVFGGEFPGDVVIGRMYIGHILLSLVVIALAVIYLRRTRSFRPSGFMLITVGVILTMAATMQVNPVWLWGPFDPAQAAAGSQPPWYMGFLDGAVRLMPAWDPHILGHELTLSLIVPALVIPGLILLPLAVYPLLEKWVIGWRDDESTMLDRARDMPVRTGLGAGFIAFYLVLWIAGGNDLVANLLHVSVNAVTRSLQVAVFVLPPLAFWVTKRICLGLQLRDRDRLLHGRETGVIMVSPDGGFSELHEPLSAYALQELASHPHPKPLDPGSATDANGVVNPAYRMDRRRAQLSQFYFADLVQVEEPTA